MELTIDTDELTARVVDMYTQVAHEPEGHFHFEMGRPLAERLGYPPDEIDRIPAASVESFAGVGYHFGLLRLKHGEQVLDLGSGSGMDTFVASLRVGNSGQVTGLDMTDAQLAKAEKLRHDAGVKNITYIKGRIEATPFRRESFDVVISNGVINLCADKQVVFREIARLLRPGGRLAISDIVTREQLPMDIVCDTKFWASCIGGAMQLDLYRESIETAGLRVERVVENPEYHFLTSGAARAGDKYGVRSISLLAIRPQEAR